MRERSRASQLTTSGVVICASIWLPFLLAETWAGALAQIAILPGLYS